MRINTIPCFFRRLHIKKRRHPLRIPSSLWWSVGGNPAVKDLRPAAPTHSRPWLRFSGCGHHYTPGSEPSGVLTPSFAHNKRRCLSGISFVMWWSVGGSNLQAIAEHVEMKGGQHAISFHPTTHPITLQSSTKPEFVRLTSAFMFY